MHAYADRDLADERKAGETDIQFFYKTRKKAWGPFKQQTWDIPTEVRKELNAELQAKFEFLIRQLKANDTREITLRHVVQKAVEVEPPAVAVKA
jgi:fructose-bisphosphate aldolase class II